MSFGDRHLDNALDRWLTTDPQEDWGEEDFEPDDVVYHEEEE
jgi:hypothetical protein